MNDSLINFRIEPPLALITLNRADKLNAVNGAMIHELNAALDQAEADPAVRVILIDGAGRAFSAGFDLNMDAGEGDPEKVRAELQRDFDIIMRFWHSPKVTVAAVHGYCLGSGMELALACDLTLSAESCRFGAPEVRFGSGIVALLVPWLAGPKRAKHMLLSGDDTLSARQAEAWGLVGELVADEKLAARARALALAVAGNDELAVRLTKRAINKSCELAGMEDALSAALELDKLIETTETEESKAFNEILATQGTRAAIAWRRLRVVSQGNHRPETS